MDTDAPTILSVTAPAGTYASGQHVPIRVTFVEFVDLAAPHDIVISYDVMNLTL